MSRIAVAQWRQETNTFNPNPTVLADYERFGLVTDAGEILERYRQVDELGGFFDVLCERPDVEILPFCRAVAWSGGRLTTDAFGHLLGLMMNGLEAALPVDAVLLSLHGACAAQGEPDVSGRVVAAVRALVGPDVPIGVSLDLHANVTRLLLRGAEVVVGYHANPHIDMVETGRRTAELLLRTLAGEIRPVTAFRKLPLLVGAERQSTFDGPLGEIFDVIRAAKQSGQVLNSNLYPVQPWLDVPDLASATVVTTNGDPVTANELADRLADMLWERRDACGEELLTPDQVARVVAEAERGPVVISDGADATNSGAPGDSTVLLRAFLAAGTPGPVLISVVDPAAASICARAGVAGEVTVAVGGKLDPRTGPPVELTGTVAAVTDGRYTVSGHGGSNVPVDAGLSVQLAAGEIRLAITSGSVVGSHPNVYRNVGLEPAEARAVVAKSPHGFRHDYGPFAARIVLADCPGAATGDYSRLVFQETRFPLHPIDAVESWRDSPCQAEALVPLRGT